MSVSSSLTVPALVAASAVPLVLIGPPASGKTLIGERLAESLTRTFTDTDAQITAEYGDISQLFEQYGEGYFREKEREHVIAALSRGGVVALGGGAVLRADTRSDLEKCCVVLLEVSAEVAAQRLNGDSFSRPLSPDIHAWQQLVRARVEVYRSTAHCAIDTSGRSPEEIVSEITDWLSHLNEESDDGSI